MPRMSAFFISLVLLLTFSSNAYAEGDGIYVGASGPSGGYLPL
jgi:hypothetical protein